MTDVPPEADRGQPTKTTTEQVPPASPADAARTDLGPEQATPAAGTTPVVTPGAEGTPPWGSPVRPPWAPAGEHDQAAGAGSATPPWGGPPWGGPPSGPQSSGGPQWGGPPWGPPPWGPWYGWGPGPTWQTPPAQTRTATSRRPNVSPWTIAAAVLAFLALIGLGVLIGFSVWGSAPASSASSGSPALKHPGLFPGTSTKRAFLGVEVAPNAFATPSGSKSSPGAHVVKVVPGSPAAKAGIVRGDVITRFGTQRVSAALTLSFDVQRDSPGQHVKVTWLTAKGRHDSATVTLATRPAGRSLG